MIRDRPGPAVLLLLPLAFAGLWALSWNRSLTGDEAYSIAVSMSPPAAVYSNAAVDVHLPAHFLYLGAWGRLLGTGLLTLRTSSLLPALVLCAMAALTMRRSAALLLCVSPFLLHLGVELRMYGLMALLGGVELVLLERVLERRSPRDAILLVACLCVAVWVHYFAWLGVVAAASLLFLRRRPGLAALAVAIPLLLFLPWLPEVGGQAERLAGAKDEVTSMLISQRAPIMALVEAPLSIAGTLFRFASGTASADFDRFSPASMGVWPVLGFAQLALLGAAAVRGARRAGPAALFILLWTLVPLSFIRPSARHFAMALPAFMSIAAAGLESAGRLRKPATALAVGMSLALCVPFATRHTLPQRCTFDRDLQEAASVAAAENGGEDLPIVCYLDSYTTLAFLYHFDQTGTDPSAIVWHPYREAFAARRFIFDSPVAAIGYMMHDTDSLVAVWDSAAGGPYLLLANDPRDTRGPVLTGADSVIGSGSDVMADRNLITSLEVRSLLREIPLENSGGPFSIFVVRRK